jgi:hypothetical protein
MTDWNKLKVVDLRAELKKRGLAYTGLKPQLVARLAAAVDDGSSESEATVQGDALKIDATGSTTSPDTISPTQLSADLTTEPHADAPQATSDPRPESVGQDVAPQDGSIVSLAVETQNNALPTESTNATDSSQPPAQSGDHESTLSSVEPQEALDDRQKRKRRSETPPISAADTARKRLRANEDTEESEDKVVTTEGDSTWTEKHNAVDKADVNAASTGVAQENGGVEPGPATIDVREEEVVAEQVVEAGKRLSTQDESEGSPVRQRDSRFKGLFAASQGAPSLEEPIPRDSGYEAGDQPDRVVDPAIHPATSALYIRDFMRPLNTPQLKLHLAALATPTGHDVDPDLVVSFYIDPIRTHAFVLFKNVSAAARVRSALHGSIWPEERNRKPLWVDFIPADKIDDWIYQEQSNSVGGRSTAKKWEVVYHNVDEDRPIEATLEEANNQPITRQPSNPGPPRTSEPLSRELDGPPRRPRSPSREPTFRDTNTSTSLSTLDQLFKSTIAKPLLYWQPVPSSLADKRLDAIDYATSKDAADRVTGEINRYTFEDGDVLVDRGPEIFPGIRPPRGYRGPGRGGGSRGGFQSRGGWGGAYDSYRGDPNFRGDRGDRRGSRDDWRY